MNDRIESAHPQIFTSAHRWVRPFFVFATLFFITITLLSDAIYDTGDGIMHYLIARHSWDHRDLFLHHWGKPVFTLIASIPAQFGYKGIVIFNVLLHIGTAWLTWRIADRMKLPFAFLAGPLVLFAPVSFGVAQSGLTEPLFAFTLMFAFYFLTGARYKTAALIISLLPFVRTEGILLAPLFGLFFLLRKEYFPMALLATGTLLYSILGAIFVHHDFLWIIHQNPYKGEVDYGHGTLFHFVDNNEFLFGWAMSFLLLPGLATAFFRKKFTPVHSLAEILIAGCFVVFFVAHSVFWWKGLVGSYGLLRVIACVIPCAVIISLRGMQLLSILFRQNKIAVATCALLVPGLTIFNSIRQHHLVLVPDVRQLNTRAVVDKIIAQELTDLPVYCADPQIALLLNKDPFNTQEWSDIGQLHNYNPQPGTLVVWEDHFALHQSNMTMDVMERLYDVTIWREVELQYSGMAGDSIPVWMVFEIVPRAQQ